VQRVDELEPVRVDCLLLRFDLGLVVGVVRGLLENVQVLDEVAEALYFKLECVVLPNLNF
jgi:hypothetical protein